MTETSLIDWIINGGIILLKIFVIVIPLMLGVAYLTYAERKLIGYMQLRIGPNRVGPRGWLQPIADALKLLEHALRDFRLAGVGLPEEDKRRFREIRQALAKAATRFEQNLQDATDAWSLHLEDEARVSGLPAATLQRARRAAADDQFQAGEVGRLPPGVLLQHLEHGRHCHVMGDAGVLDFYGVTVAAGFLPIEDPVAGEVKQR